MNPAEHADPDDMFSDTRMTFGEHIEDLRTHLIRAIKGFVLMMLASLYFAPQILHFMTAPVEAELKYYYERYLKERANELRLKIENNALDLPVIDIPVILKKMDPPRIEAKPHEVMPQLVQALTEWLRARGFDDLLDPRPEEAEKEERFIMRIPDPLKWGEQMKNLQLLMEPPSLTSLSIQEPFMVYFKVSMLAGFVLSSPWVFYQIWSFIAAGLYPNEKRLVNVYLPVSLFLFLFGCFICQFFVIPKAIAALLWFNELLGVKPDLRLNEWLGFAIFMPVVFGISFQTPLVMLFTFMVGLFDIDTFREKRRHAWFFMAIFSAVATPSTDAISMLFMLIPMCLLYEFGIWLCWYRGRKEDETPEYEDSQELVEV